MIILPLCVSIPVGRTIFNKAERRFGIDGNVGFIDGTGTGVIWLIGGLTFVDVGGLFTTADVAFSFACAKIWATSGDNLSNDNDERLDAVGFVEGTGTLFGVESTSLTDDPWLDSDDNVF